MYVPVLKGLIDRRVLVNFTVDAEVAERQLPPPFRPKLVRGRAVAGICLLRLAQIRPRPLPACVGLASENAAHRFAVEWETAEGVREGVYIPRRDSASRLNVLVGGCLFPGEHHRAAFDVSDRNHDLRISLRSEDGATRVRVEGYASEHLPDTSVFASRDEASAFFERGCVGYSATACPGEFDGMQLHAPRWKVRPLTVTRVESSFFADLDRFPAGSVVFDSALLMRSIEHEWRGMPKLRAAA